MNLQRLKTDLLALGLLAATVFVGLSLLSYDPADPPSTSVYPPAVEAVNWGGPAGAKLAHHLRNLWGLGAYFLFASMVLLDFRLFCRTILTDPLLRVIGILLMLTAVSVGIQHVWPHVGGGPLVGSGGYVGAYGVYFLEPHLSETGFAILAGAVFVSGMLLATDALLFRILRGVALVPVRVLIGACVVLTLPLRLLRRRRKPSVDELFDRVLTSPSPRAEDAPAAAEAEDSELHEESDEEADALADVPVNAAPPVHAATEDVSEEAAEELENEEMDEEDELPVPVVAAPAPARKPIRINPPVSAPSARDEMIRRLDASSERQDGPVHPLPEPSLLEDAEDFPYDLLAKKARVAAATLEKTFKEFGLNVRVVEIDTGPVITQFELELEAGLRLSKVTALADDLAIALRVPSVRVVAPIPGKNTVGVEVPNDKQVMVRLRELIESCPQELENKRIPIFLGKDVSGRPLTVDLTKMPHLLIAGRTGTGKSVCLNTLILSMLMTRTPEQVKMLMIDPKMVELSPYMRIPHLMHPVITDMKKAEAILAWAVDKMEERYDLLARCGVRHLDSYNKLGREEILRRMGEDPDSEEAERIPTTMPYIVIIADEMADMMMTSGKDVEGHIIRLAQKSRAVGIHLVLATQKPTVDVITGLIKSNLPARISFQVASRVDSRVVLDEMGADKLLGNGDMLYLAPGTSHLTRAQGTYVSDDEVNRVIEFYSDQEPQYSRELAQLSTNGAKGKTGIEALRSRDEVYEQAIEVVVREGRGSVSLLQRCLGIGYGRAARLIDYMAEDGIVGDYNGSQAREVLYTPEQWEALVRGEELESAAV